MKQAFFKTTQVFKTVMPMLTGVLLLVSLLHQFFKNNYQHWFSGNLILDPFIGAIAGSISFGMPVTSYVVGGELLHAGVSLLAVTAFIMSWTTVGLIMIPLEASALGMDTLCYYSKHLKFYFCPNSCHLNSVYFKVFILKA
jgi:hypothetical protein